MQPSQSYKMKVQWKLAAFLTICALCLYVVTRPNVNEHEADVRNVLYVNSVVRQGKSTPNIDKHMFNASTHSDEIDKMLQEKYGPIKISSARSVNTSLTSEEMERYVECVKNGPRDRDQNGSKFWGKAEHIRRTHHTYLAKEDAILMEVGGNQGNDATEFAKLYNPRYIILEPLEQYAEILREKFHNNSRVTVINLGLGTRDEVVLVKVEGNNACATSKFSGAGGNTPLYVTNATNFMLKLGVGLFDIDLLTMNCEGCEFEALEVLLSTTLVEHIKNIQWATHSTIKGITSPIERYCKIQQLLSRTHRPTYQYKFIWESWRRRGVP